jgi:hypothetical protein
MATKRKMQAATSWSDLTMHEGPVYVRGDNVGELIESLKKLPKDAPVLLETNGTLSNLVFARIETVHSTHGSAKPEQAAILTVHDKEYFDKMKADAAAAGKK